MNKAIFLDKDGTLIEDVPYNVNPDLVRFTLHAIEGLQLLQVAGYRLIIITNQSGIARGIFKEADLQPLFNYIEHTLAEQNIHITGFYYSPNHPEGTVAPYNISCNNRKPMPGMLLQAAKDHQINLSASWMIGDILHDVEAGKRAGCKSVLINNGGETEWIKDNPYREPDFIAADIKEAAVHIIEQSISTLQPV